MVECIQYLINTEFLPKSKKESITLQERTGERKEVLGVFVHAVEIEILLELNHVLISVLILNIHGM